MPNKELNQINGAKQQTNLQLEIHKRRYSFIDVNLIYSLNSKLILFLF